MITSLRNNPIQILNSSITVTSDGEPYWPADWANEGRLKCTSMTTTYLMSILSVSKSWVPTANQINSIKPDQAVGNWSGSVGMSGRGRSVELGRIWSENLVIGMIELIGSAVGTNLISIQQT
ncbi:hypothetical protein DPMN_160021 [Dreissena polymorpha]|uniref:Uncharacterized protein n=1 Tax=Dreissena polymorpha TaxID=45954 RepID=A0A9D4ELK0_DREPO|nr:hypothetical protein DPMN_160021 [Dreissena polymorpha]